MIDLRGTISKLIRAFGNRENQLKLKAYEQKSAEFNAFQDSILQLQKLFTYKLNTPLEDVNSIKDNLKQLKEKTETLTDHRNSKKDQYDKYVEECNKSRELRGITMKILSQQVGTENRFDAGSLSGFVKLYRCKEIIEVGERHSGHAQLGHGLGQRLYSNQPID